MRGGIEKDWEEVQQRKLNVLREGQAGQASWLMDGSGDRNKKIGKQEMAGGNEGAMA